MLSIPIVHFKGSKFEPCFSFKKSKDNTLPNGGNPSVTSGDSLLLISEIRHQWRCMKHQNWDLLWTCLYIYKKYIYILYQMAFRSLPFFTFTLPCHDFHRCLSGTCRGIGAVPACHEQWDEKWWRARGSRPFLAEHWELCLAICMVANALLCSHFKRRRILQINCTWSSVCGGIP